MTAFQRSLVLGLAILVLMNSFGIFALMYAGAGIHRVFESEEKNTSCIVLSESEFAALTWVGKHDFIYNGTVYDCDSISSVNGKIALSCHADQEETHLKNSLSDQFETGSKNPVSKPMKELAKTFPVFLFEAPLLLPSAENSGVALHSSCVQHSQSADIRLNSPPPEQA